MGEAQRSRLAEVHEAAAAFGGAEATVPASSLPAWDIEALRPGVAWLLALPHEWLTKPERAVLTWLALDSYRLTPAPGVPELMRRTGFSRNSVEGALATLQRPNEKRPALIEHTGRRRSQHTIYRLRVEVQLPHVLGDNTPTPWGGSTDDAEREHPHGVGWFDPQPPQRPPQQLPQSTGDTQTHTQVLTSPPPTTDGSAREAEGAEDFALRTGVLGALRAAGVHDQAEAEDLCEVVLQSVRKGETRNPVARLGTPWLDELRRERGRQLRGAEPRCQLCSQPERLHHLPAYSDHTFEAER